MATAAYSDSSVAAIAASSVELADKQVTTETVELLYASVACYLPAIAEVAELAIAVNKALAPLDWTDTKLPVYTLSAGLLAVLVLLVVSELLVASVA